MKILTGAISKILIAMFLLSSAFDNQYELQSKLTIQNHKSKRAKKSRVKRSRVKRSRVKRSRVTRSRVKRSRPSRQDKKTRAIERSNTKTFRKISNKQKVRIIIGKKKKKGKEKKNNHIKSISVDGGSSTNPPALPGITKNKYEDYEDGGSSTNPSALPGGITHEDEIDDGNDTDSDDAKFRLNIEYEDNKSPVKIPEFDN